MPAEETDLERAERVLDAAIVTLEKDAETIRRLKRTNAALVEALRDAEATITACIDALGLPMNGVNGQSLQRVRTALTLVEESDND